MFQTVDQPAVVRGNWTSAGFCFTHTLATLLLAYIVSRKRGKETDNSTDDEERSDGQLNRGEPEIVSESLKGP